MEKGLSPWLIPLLGDDLEFLHNGKQTIHIKGIRVGTHLEVSAKVHVPGYFSWGFNRMKTDSSFSLCVRDVLIRVVNQMYDVGADTSEILPRIKTIWNFKQ